MANKIYGFISLTGGTQGCLDYLTSAPVANGDMAYGVVDNVQYTYVFDASSTAAANPPLVIAPISGTGRWLIAPADHGLLGGLSDDDHPQYVKHSIATAENDFLVASGAGEFAKKTPSEVAPLIDHGALGGLGDDDHTQYHNDTRGDARYEPKSSDFTSKVSAASDTAAGKVELATAAETTTGTDTGRAVTPDGLSGSDFGKRVVEWFVIDSAASLTTGDGKAYFIVPTELNGYNLVRASATVITAGTTNSTTIQIHNVTDAVDMLSTPMNIETGEASTRTSATPGTIDTTKDDVATGDILRCDIDAVSTTAPKGLIVELVFQLP